MRRNKRFKGSSHVYGRKSKKLPPKPLILIITEGIKTEPEYFNGLRKYKRINRDRVRIISSKVCGGTDPDTIVKCAKDAKRQLEKDAGLSYDEVWCVFDRDEHQNLKQAIDKAYANKLKIAFSNPCFELWCYLHFELQTAYIDRKHC